MERKDELYALSAATGATRADSAIDIDGGIGVLLAYAGKGRRELPDAGHVVDGAAERLSRDGSFAGVHVATPLRGLRSTSTPSTSPAGGCSRSWPRRCSPACRRSSSPPVRPPTSPRRWCG